MSIYAELKRRNVIRVALLYGVASWVILQVADVLFLALELPASSVRLVLAILILGFPLVVIFSWVYELTPEGIKLEKEVERSESVVHETGRKLNVAIVVLLVVAIGGLVADRLIPETTSGVSPEFADSGATTSDEVSGVPEKSIAVLPFVNMSDDASNEYFSDGLSEELLNLLARMPELRVAARTSSFSFKDKDTDIATIASHLNVAHVLEGSVRKSGNQIRITVQLIKADDGFHLWTESYDRMLDDIFAIQDEISAAVVDALKIEILGDKPTANPIDADAYVLYLQGRHLKERDSAADRASAIKILARAIEFEPNLPQAWTEIFFVRFNQGNFGELAKPESERLAREALQRALELDDQLADAHVATSWVDGFYDFNWVKSIGSAQRALELDPNNVLALHALAYLSFCAERFEPGLGYAQRAYAIDPLNLETHRHLASGLNLLGRYDEAAAVARRGLVLAPNNDRSRFNLGISYLLSDNAAAALQEFDQLNGPIFRGYARTLALYALGRQSDADAQFAQLQEEFAQLAAFQIALVYGYVGDYDAAFESLDKAYEYRDFGVSFTRAAIAFNNMRSDPRWQAYLEKIGLSEQHLADVEL